MKIAWSKLASLCLLLLGNNLFSTTNNYHCDAFSRTPLQYKPLIGSKLLRGRLEMRMKKESVEKTTFLQASTTSSTPSQDLLPKEQYELSPQQFIYVALTSIFVTCLIIADVIGVKLFELPLPFEVFGHKTVEHTCGMLTFPLTFLIGDIINEYYGSKAAKNTVYIGK